MSAPITVDLHGFAHGGEAVGRLPDGRVVFVAHGIPGETVTVEITETHKRWCRARLVDVLVASKARVEPPCPYFGPDRCGGCRLQHIDADLQRRLLRQVVVDQLERLGGIEDPPVAETVDVGRYGYRNRARFAVTADGALGFRRHASHDLIPIDRCLLLDEPTSHLRDHAGDAFAGHAEVEVRTGTTGSAVVVDPSKAAETVAGNPPLTETVGGLSFRVSSTSFFQSNRAGAEVLLDLVRRSALVGAGDTALDLYAGVGLFARGLAADGAAVLAVEGNPASVEDARANLDGVGEVAAGPVAAVLRHLRTEDRRFDVVVADPPRRGAGRGVIDDVAAIAVRTIVIVACDPAALGRDAGILRAAGWSLLSAVPVDQFAQTGHVEVVATFGRVRV